MYSIPNTPFRLKLPEYARQELEKCAFQEELGMPTRRCVVNILEQDALIHIHPESFDFSQVYGDCELLQVMKDVVISKFQFQKNHRSFEKEAEAGIK